MVKGVYNLFVSGILLTSTLSLWAGQSQISVSSTSAGSQITYTVTNNANHNWKFSILNAGGGTLVTNTCGSSIPTRGNCSFTITGQTSTVSFDYGGRTPYEIPFNKPATGSGSYGYVVSPQTNQLYSCSLSNNIMPADTSCSVASMTTTPSTALGVAVNSSGTYVYTMSGNAADIYSCQVTNGTWVGNCNITTNLGLYGQLSITLTTDNSTLYVAEGVNGGLYHPFQACTVTNNVVTSCEPVTNHTGYSDSEGTPNTILYSAGMIYTTNNYAGNANTLYVCTPTTTTDWTCTSYAGLNVNTPVGIAINSNKTIAYVANSGAGADAVSYCNLNAGAISGSCTYMSGSAGYTPQVNGIALSPDGKYLYISNNNDEICSCSLSTDGTNITSCTCNGFAYPAGIATYNY